MSMAGGLRNTLVADARIEAIAERTVWAKSSTEGLVAQLAADLDYLLARLDAAERAALTGRAYLLAAAPFLGESFARMATAPPRSDFVEAFTAWQDLRER